MRYQNYENETWITKLDLGFAPYIEGESTSEERAKQIALEKLKNMKGILVKEGKGKNSVARVLVFTKWKVYYYTLHSRHCAIEDKSKPIVTKSLTGREIVNYDLIWGCEGSLKPCCFPNTCENWCWRYREDTEEGQKEESYY